VRTFVDRGGTFTDVVTIDDEGLVSIRKVPSDRARIGDLARGTLTFGTTVATNALLERAGVPTLLVVTAGFEDLVHIGTMARPDLFDPAALDPPPLCARVVGVKGRIAPDGAEVEPLELPADLDLSGLGAIAVALLHAPANPSHELRVAAEIARRAPTLHIAMGHAVDPEVGYLDRIHTALVDAAITPVLWGALARDGVPDRARAMRSDGSTCDAAALRAPDAVLSGPAGGVLAVWAVAAHAGFQAAVGLDMGGTSTDVCRVDARGLPRHDGAREIAGVRLRRPTLDVHTIAAGGGSVLSAEGGRLHVGPRSAGADPGPQCYGRGGPPTLTDAALAAGLMDPRAFDPPLRADLVSLPGDAQDFVDLARERMAAAVRRLAEREGADLRDHALVAYGGAAGQHAAAVAERLGIGTVLLHPCASVLSAFGQALARAEEEAVTPLWAPLDTTGDGSGLSGLDLDAALDRLEAGLPSLGAAHRRVELRARGTDHALRIPCIPPCDPGSLAARFAEEHRRRYGFSPGPGPIEVVNARVRAVAPPAALPAVDDDPWGIGERAIDGPCRLDAPTTSVVVPSGWTARRDRGLLRLDLVRLAPRLAPTAPTPAGLALWGHRFMAVAERAGEVLRRLARSVNIRERLDFSCAIFDPEGRLVANAPHIPVHLGAMGETVRDLIAAGEPLPPGQAWLTNDPAAGGSHLPDLTVITAVHHDGERFFVACRGHHVDVGGLTPGSMPPGSTRLADEGFVVRRLPLLRDGELRPDLAALLDQSRQPDVVIADLRAQIAANHHAAAALRALGPAPLLRAWMAHLQDLAAAAVAELLPGLSTGAATDLLDGLPLRVRVSVREGRAILDLAGTGGPHPGNLNAPPAVTRAAALYALRVLVGRPIPLNDGALRDVVLSLPSPSLVDPPPGAAVVGGNVETSQRIVDLILRATGRSAAGAGSMSNLTVGGVGWSFYETLGGGAGARPDGPGASARQEHMTNTRATDVEVLERRLPLRVHRFAIRRGSGGAGEHRGGDGLVREIALLRPGTAALLAAWRPGGAPGLGGDPGAPGSAEVDDGGGWRPWAGEAVALDAGARVRVSTPGGGGWRASTGPMDEP
jgi:5-oxoprolinase (ATP-hydrolysing)